MYEQQLVQAARALSRGTTLSGYTGPNLACTNTSNHKGPRTNRIHRAPVNSTTLRISFDSRMDERVNDLVLSKGDLLVTQPNYDQLSTEVGFAREIWKLNFRSVEQQRHRLAKFVTTHSSPLERKVWRDGILRYRRTVYPHFARFVY